MQHHFTLLVLFSFKTKLFMRIAIYYSQNLTQVGSRFQDISIVLA